MTELSPAAQAVLDALIFLPFSDKAATMEGCAAQQAAAVLKAAVDQVAPEPRAFISPGTASQIRSQFLAIAAELGGGTTTPTES
jgi:hypothetical protein